MAKAGQPADTCQPRGERQLRRAKPPAGQPTSQRRARPQDQPFWFTAGRHPQQRGTRPWPRRVLPALFLAGRGCGPSPGCGKPAWRRIGRALSKLAAGARVGRPRARRPARRQTRAAHSARGARGKVAACRGWWRARCSAAAARLAHARPAGVAAGASDPLAGLLRWRPRPRARPGRSSPSWFRAARPPLTGRPGAEKTGPRDFSAKNPGFILFLFFSAVLQNTSKYFKMDLHHKTITFFPDGRGTSKYFKILQNTSKCFKILQNTSKPRRGTSKYFKILQNEF